MLPVQLAIVIGVVIQRADGKAKQQEPRKIQYGKRKGKTRKSEKTAKLSEKAVPSSNIDVMDSLVQTRQVNYELDEGDDVYFKIYCFFKDWNDIREYLQEWRCDWTDAIIRLTCVPLITNTLLRCCRGRRGSCSFKSTEIAA
jgi:hypothetical protein